MNLDKLQHFPNQNAEGELTECVSISMSDIWGNYRNIPFEPDFPYAATDWLTGQTPNIDGLDPFWAMQAAVTYGFLPASDDTSNALQMGQLYVVNWKNYTDAQKAEALKYAPPGVKQLYSFDQIADWTNTQKLGVMIPIKWYGSFANPLNGILAQPFPNEFFSYHAIAVYDCEGDYLIFKPWFGKDYGVNGYGRIHRDLLLQVWEGVAYSFNPQASRYLSLLWNILALMQRILHGLA